MERDEFLNKYFENFVCKNQINSNRYYAIYNYLSTLNLSLELQIKYENAVMEKIKQTFISTQD